MAKIAVVDYGVGNLMSVTNAFEYLGMSACITSDPAEMSLADAIVLPGVGAFPDAAEKLRGPGLDMMILDQAGKKPVLGICLGMQLLFSKGEELRPTPGLGLIPGTVDRIRTDLKLPHIGWNSLHLQNDSPIFRGIPDGSYVYFVHSYCGYAELEETVTARTDYGTSIVAAVGRENIYGTQFHPEKSGDIGLQILKNFGELNV